MQVFVMINGKTNTFSLEDDDLNKYETLYELIEKRLKINKNFFILNNGCKRLKEFDEIKHETTLYLNYKFINSKKLCIKDKEYYIPINIMLESKMISNMITDEEESIESFSNMENGNTDIQDLIVLIVLGLIIIFIMDNIFKLGKYIGNKK